MNAERQNVVLVSERLGAIGAHERRIERTGATVRSASLWTTQDICSNGFHADVILGAVEPLDKEALSSLPSLKAVVRRGVGYDNVTSFRSIELHAALVESSRHLLNEESRSLMCAPTPPVVNTSRGGLVDEPALVRAMQRGTLGGAGLDVTEHEPATLEGRRPAAVVNEEVYASPALRVTALRLAQRRNYAHGASPVMS